MTGGVGGKYLRLEKFFGVLFEGKERKVLDLLRYIELEAKKDRKWEKIVGRGVIEYWGRRRGEVK